LIFERYLMKDVVGDRAIRIGSVPYV